MEDGLGAAGSMILVNNVVSQSVPHLHLHVIPRNPKDGLRFWLGPRQRSTPSTRPGSTPRRSAPRSPASPTTACRPGLVHRADRDRQHRGAAAGDRPGLVDAAVGGHVVVREGVAEAARGGGVHDSGVVVGHRAGVVVTRVLAVGLVGVDEQGAAVERGRQPGDDGERLGARPGGAERPGRAAEDVGGGGRAKAPTPGKVSRPSLT